MAYYTRSKYHGLGKLQVPIWDQTDSWRFYNEITGVKSIWKGRPIFKFFRPGWPADTPTRSERLRWWSSDRWFKNLSTTGNFEHRGDLIYGINHRRGRKKPVEMTGWIFWHRNCDLSNFIHHIPNISYCQKEILSSAFNRYKMLCPNVRASSSAGLPWIAPFSSTPRTRTFPASARLK